MGHRRNGSIVTTPRRPPWISRRLGGALLLAWAIILSLAAFSLAVAAQTVEDIYREASAAFDRGDFEQAVGLYEKALRLRPDSVPIRTDLGVALVRLGHYSEAIDNYKEALKSDPENMVVRLNLALAWYKEAEFLKAAGELENVRRKNPDNRQALYLLADCYLRLAKNDDVVALLRPAYEANSGDLAVDYALGTALIRQGKIHEGEVVIDPILKRGDSPEANLLLGEAQFAAKDYGAAAATLRKALDQNQNLPEAWSLYGHALLNAGAEDLSAAKTAFQRAIQLDPNDFSANLLLGSIYRREGDYRTALPYEERALRLRPASPEARFQVAALHASLGKLEDSRNEFEQLEREFPEFLEVHVQLAVLYARMNLPEASQRERDMVQKINEKARETELRPRP